MSRIAIIVAAVLASSAYARAHESSSPAPPKDDGATMPRIVATSHGLALVDPRGMTLYYFDRDDGGDRSTCNGKCAEKWIPLAAPADATPRGDFTVITRKDGGKMWAYRYRPLYTSPADKAPGDTHGTDFELLWHVARPE